MEISKKNQLGHHWYGKNCKSVCRGIALYGNGRLAAVASRTKERSIAFKNEWKIEYAFESYEKLAKSSKVDAVYIATPHSPHAKKYVLCMPKQVVVLSEKPFAVNSKVTK